jgi:hypothetical protein
VYGKVLPTIWWAKTNFWEPLGAAGGWEDWGIDPVDDGDIIWEGGGIEPVADDDGNTEDDWEDGGIGGIDPVDDGEDSVWEGGGIEPAADDDGDIGDDWEDGGIDPVDDEDSVWEGGGIEPVADDDGDIGDDWEDGGIGGIDLVDDGEDSVWEGGGIEPAADDDGDLGDDWVVRGTPVADGEDTGLVRGDEDVRDSGLEGIPEDNGLGIEPAADDDGDIGDDWVVRGTPVADGEDTGLVRGDEDVRDNGLEGIPEDNGLGIEPAADDDGDIGDEWVVRGTPVADGEDTGLVRGDEDVGGSGLEGIPEDNGLGIDPVAGDGNIEDKAFVVGDGEEWVADAGFGIVVDDGWGFCLLTNRESLSTSFSLGDILISRVGVG